MERVDNYNICFCNIYKNYSFTLIKYVIYFDTLAFQVNRINRINRIFLEFSKLLAEFNE